MVASRSEIGLGRLTAFTIVSLFITHAIAFFLHEYSHATMAWLLGIKSHPLDITYGHLDLSNVLLQQEMDENVDYQRAFEAGRSRAVALTALSGPGLGNGVLYLLCAAALAWMKPSRFAPRARLFVTLLALVAAGNLWSYAPVRTITTHGDMANAAKGLGITAWQLFPFVVTPSALAGIHFFASVLPAALERAIGEDVPQSAFLIAICCTVYFGFYGGCPSIGGNYGNVSAVFAILSLLVLLPISLAALLHDHV